MIRIINKRLTEEALRIIKKTKQRIKERKRTNLTRDENQRLNQKVLNYAKAWADAGYKAKNKRKMEQE